MAIRSASRGSRRWNWREGAHANALEGEGVLSAIRHGRLFALVGITFGELREVLAEVGIERGRRFDFCWNEFSPGVFDQIDLDTIGVSVKIEVGTLACIIRPLHLFENDEILEKAAAKRVVHQLFYGVDPGQCAGESGVVKIDLWRFHETLATVLVPGREKKADVRRVEDGKPFPYRFRGYAAIVREGRDIKNGADASHDKLEKCAEKSCVLDVQELMDIAFHVCGTSAGFMQYGKFTSRIALKKRRRYVKQEVNFPNYAAFNLKGVA